MAAIAGLGRPLVLIPDVAFTTVDLFVYALQSKLCADIVVKISDGCPGCGGMTLITGLTKLTLMKIEMTIPTRRIYGLKVPFRMTPRTGHALMLAREGKSARVMVEKRYGPR